MPKPDLSRRGVLGAVTFVPVSAVAAAPKQTFSGPRLQLITAFVDRLIPAGDGSPGAVAAGVPTYIDRSFAAALAAERPAFESGLDATDAFSKKRHGFAFADLDAAKKDEILTALENNEAEAFAPDSRTFFYRVRQLTIEGMFGDPFYGGNQAFAGWDLIRYPGPRMAVSAGDQEMKKTIRPVRASAHGDRHGH